LLFNRRGKLILKAVDHIQTTHPSLQKKLSKMAVKLIQKYEIVMSNNKSQGEQKSTESFDAHLFHFTAELAATLDFNFGVFNGTTDFTG